MFSSCRRSRLRGRHGAHTRNLVRKVLPYVPIGTGVGASNHGFVPAVVIAGVLVVGFLFNALGI